LSRTGDALKAQLSRGPDAIQRVRFLGGCDELIPDANARRPAFS